MSGPKPPAISTLVGEDLGLCPFCQQPIAVSKIGDGYGVLHGLPMCSKYERLEPDKFISAVVAEKAKTAPS